MSNSTTFGTLVRVVMLATTPLLAFAQSQLPVLEPTQGIGGTAEETQPVRGQPPATLLFGAAIALDAGTALVGMPGYPGDFNEGVGRAAVFVKDHSGAWERAGTLDPSDGVAGDQFGQRVALDDDVALVASARGIYVFRRVKRNWIQIQKLPATSAAPLDGGLALEDDVAFVGTSRPEEPSAVEIFEFGKHGRLHQVQTLTATEETPGDAFAEDLAVSHNRLIVGAAGDNDGQGASYLFGRRGRRWVESQKLTAIDGQAGEGFGATVSIADKVVAIGAPTADINPDFSQCEFGHSGAAYVFEPHGRFWSEQQKIATPSDCAALFAFDLKVSDRWLVAATPAFFPGQNSMSFVYRRDGGVFAETAKILNSDESDAVLALERSTLFVGLPTDRFFSTGEASIYELQRSR